MIISLYAGVFLKLDHWPIISFSVMVTSIWLIVVWGYQGLVNLIRVMLGNFRNDTASNGMIGLNRMRVNQKMSAVLFFTSKLSYLSKVNL